MNPQNGPDRLSNDLKRLEPPVASADFTARVLAGLDARVARRRRHRALAVSVAVPAAIVLIAAVVMLARPSSEPADTYAEDLRQQHRQLQAELARLEQARDQSRTVLYLGTGEDYDLVLDLEPLLDRSITAPVVPALHDLRGQPARVVEASRRQP